MKKNRLEIAFEIIKILDFVITRHPKFSVFLTVLTSVVATILALALNAEKLVIIIQALK